MNQSSVILVPTYKSIEPECEDMLRKLEARGFRVERRFGFSAIDGARAHLATWAILRGYEWLYWIDSDIQFSMADFGLLEREGGKFSCGPYQQKQPGGSIAVLGDTNQSSRGLIPVRAAGFGFMKTHRSIYEAMMKDLPVCRQTPTSEPLVPFFQPRWWPIDDRTIYFGEDYSFCLHAEKLGFQLLANFEIQIGHIGRYAYRIREEF